MSNRYLVGAAAAAGILVGAGIASAQTNDATSSGPAVNGSPAWFRRT